MCVCCCFSFHIVVKRKKKRGGGGGVLRGNFCHGLVVRLQRNRQPYCVVA